MAETIVWRAAESAYEYFRLNWWTDPTKPWKELSEPERAHWIASQRAAIAALREPTKAMWEAHADADKLGISHWHAMIDEALK